tara:strand:- start:2009 stop:3619 length:1611 start_codon:yes stop_codon:yes gene_type:complete
MAISIVTNQIKDAQITNAKIVDATIQPAKINLGAVFNFSAIPQVSADPSNQNDLVRKKYVDEKIQGLSYKHACKVRMTSNVNIASPGATLDSTSMSVDDRVLLTNQSTDTECGIYLWKGAAAAMVRADDASTFQELQDGAAVLITNGSSASQAYTQQATISSFASQDWVLFSASSGGRGAGPGLTLNGNNLEVNTDGSSTEISGGNIRVKAAGITNAMLAGSIENGKLSNSTVGVSSGQGLTGGSASLALGGSTSLAVQNDGGTISVGAGGIKVSDAGIGEAQLSNSAVTSNKIADGSVILDKLSNLNSANVLIGSAGNRPTAQSISGAITLSNAGVTALANNSVVTAAVTDGNITNVKLQHSAIAVTCGSGLSNLGSMNLGSSNSLDLVLDGSTLSKSGSGLKVNEIDTAQLAAACITAPKLAANCVESGSIASAAISTVKLADDCVTIAKLGLTWKRNSITGSTNLSYDLSEAVTAGYEDAVMVFRNGLFCKKASSPADASEYSIGATSGTGGVGQITFGASVNNDTISIIWPA